MRCGNQHDLIVAYRGHGDALSEEVVRWCQVCGAIVVDLDYDGRTAPGRVAKMRFSQLAEETCNENIKPSGPIFEDSDVSYLMGLAEKLDRGVYSINPQWVRDLAVRVQNTLARINR